MPSTQTAPLQGLSARLWRTRMRLESRARSASGRLSAKTGACTCTAGSGGISITGDSSRYWRGPPVMLQAETSRIAAAANARRSEGRRVGKERPKRGWRTTETREENVHEQRQGRGAAEDRRYDEHYAAQCTRA